ncbi:hypothetical protein NVV93_16480 [Pseudomonas sp. LS44]|uniref:hypothetical protein n=1 Tax=Pseudomonas sp. LS44 TaxID=1357074 RepID=UPI00215A7DFA|nr:hypothetical protein [Pseudomonas sp. LS44]UVE17162.1 hypothetical protein NVV93_16480 [Pseudomonas sp. LS44]
MWVTIAFFVGLLLAISLYLIFLHHPTVRFGKWLWSILPKTAQVVLATIWLLIVGLAMLIGIPLYFYGMIFGPCTRC